MSGGPGSSCIHGHLPCTCKLDDESYCRCLKCMTRLLDLAVEAGELVKNADGSYSVKE